MAYKIEFSDNAFQEFGKFDKYTQKVDRCLDSKTLVTKDNPKFIDTPPVRNKAGEWR